MTGTEQERTNVAFALSLARLAVAKIRMCRFRVHCNASCGRCCWSIACDNISYICDQGQPRTKKEIKHNQQNVFGNIVWLETVKRCLNPPESSHIAAVFCSLLLFRLHFVPNRNKLCSGSSSGNRHKRTLSQCGVWVREWELCGVNHVRAILLRHFVGAFRWSLARWVHSNSNDRIPTANYAFQQMAQNECMHRCKNSYANVFHCVLECFFPAFLFHCPFLLLRFHPILYASRCCVHSMLSIQNDDDDYYYYHLFERMPAFIVLYIREAVTTQ